MSETPERDSTPKRASSAVGSDRAEPGAAGEVIGDDSGHGTDVETPLEPSEAEPVGDGDAVLREPPDSDARVGAAPPPAELAVSTGLHTNTRLTLLFVVFITLVVVASWGSAKVACNYHPPQSRGFKATPLEKLATRPKNSALEFHHSLFVQDYDRARELADEAGAQLVDDARSACDAPCKAQRTEREEKAKTRATLFKIRGPEAWVKAETFFGDQVSAETYLLKRDQRRWLVVSKTEPPSLETSNGTQP